MVLIEKDSQLGGFSRKLHHTIEGADVRTYLEELISQITAHDKVEVPTDAIVTGFGGYKGNFTTEVKVGPEKELRTIKHGAMIVATGATDEEVAKEVEWVRYRIAFYGSTPNYWPVFEHHGFNDLGRKLNQMTKDGKWDQIAAEISDDVVHLFAAVGRYDQLADAVANRYGGATDVLVANNSTDTQPAIPRDVMKDIHAIPTKFESFKSEW